MAEPKPFASLSSGLLARKGAARPAMRPQGFGQVGNGIEDLGWNDMGHEAPKPGDAPHDASGEDINGEQPPVYHPTGLTPVQSPVHGQQAELADRLGIDPEDEEFDETAELYDPNAVDESAEDEAEESEEGDELYEAPAFEAAPLDLSEKPKKQPLQLSGGFDEPSEDVAAKEPFEPTETFNGAAQPAGGDEPYELTERFDDFDPFQETEEVQDSVPPPPAAPVYGANSGFEPAAYTPVHQPTPRAAPGTKAKAAFTLRLDPERHLKLRLACAVNGRSAQQIVTDAVDQLLREMPELEAMAEKAKRRG